MYLRILFRMSICAFWVFYKISHSNTTVTALYSIKRVLLHVFCVNNISETGMARARVPKADRSFGKIWGKFVSKIIFIWKLSNLSSKTGRNKKFKEDFLSQVSNKAEPWLEFEVAHPDYDKFNCEKLWHTWRHIPSFWSWKHIAICQNLKFWTQTLYTFHCFQGFPQTYFFSAIKKQPRRQWKTYFMEVTKYSSKILQLK